jgi:hypothetical protein
MQLLCHPLIAERVAVTFTQVEGGLLGKLKMRALCCFFLTILLKTEQNSMELLLLLPAGITGGVLIQLKELAELFFREPKALYGA